MKRSWIASLTGAALAAAVATAAPAQPAHNGDDPVEPFAIGEGLYYVGASDIAAYLIGDAKNGFILLDGGYETTAPKILASIRKLGFDPKQVKILVNSHAHLDHAGGLAQLKAATGAPLYASAQDAPLIEAGGKGDYYLGDRAPFPPAKVDRILRDGQRVSLGPYSLTAHVTAGHTKGCTTWTFPLKVDGQVRQALVLCSLTILPGAKLVNNAAYPAIAADFEKTYATLKALPCDVFLGSHGGFWRMRDKRAAAAPGKPSPFVDPDGCRAYLAKAEAGFRAELAKQQAAAGR
ncbi:subclass B3 metallo-beta-lactamase [Phenylobacterium sp.]|uniref:subclass B3 metallo-beta-lactamase n=1 Tax=Phenylobacterium sp. TaxID=1871053 RepID=UPI002E37D95B|nr:subclass B3 metallo-beta-lactamase [Phenylobacterium sp.]HEX2560482.1 subclass B3 metallo-beta-lactamase [Phenylobacterium sp.]